MVGNDLAQLVEPPQAHLGQDGALIGDRRWQHPVVGRNPVAGHDQQIVVRGGEQISDFSGVGMAIALWQLKIASGRPRR